MAWGSKRIAGVTYDLKHLDPYVINVTPTVAEAPTYRVGVMFGCHTFTRDLTAADKPDLHFKNGGETRCFCVDRHALSLGLPTLVSGAAVAGQRAFFTELRHNFLLLDGSYGAAGPYVVIFKLERARKPHLDVAMFVVSAYLKPNLPPKLPATTFATLIATVAAGKTIQVPTSKTKR